MLVRMILERTNISSTKSTATCQVALTISQLIKFNCVKWKRRESTTFVRHAVSQETPLPIYLGLMIHSTPKKRSLIDTLSSMGLSISYNRVYEIQTTLTKQICYKYQTDQLVRPPTLVDNTFTTVDHNATLNSASNHFHGTSMSLFQHEDVTKMCLSFEILYVTWKHHNRF